MTDTASGPAGDATSTVDAGAGALVARLVADGRTVATGESLTAGLVSATIASVPGCSAVLRGGVVAYQVDVKADLLGVPPAALADGVVSEAVAVALARGAATALRADLGIGTTGVAGPEPHDGAPVGSVWVAAWLGGTARAEHLALDGDREAVRRAATGAAISLASALLGDLRPGGE